MWIPPVHKRFLFWFSLRTGTVVTNIFAVLSGCFGIYINKILLYCSTTYLIIALILAWLCDDGVKHTNSKLMLPMLCLLIVNYFFCIVLLVFEIVKYSRPLPIVLLMLWLIYWWYGSYTVLLSYKKVRKTEQEDKLERERESTIHLPTCD